MWAASQSFLQLLRPLFGKAWQVAINVHASCERSEEHTSELQSLRHLGCRLLLENKKAFDNSATGGPAAHTIMVPTTPITYTVSFDLHFYLMMAAPPTSQLFPTPSSCP